MERLFLGVSTVVMIGICAGCGAKTPPSPTTESSPLQVTFAIASRDLGSGHWQTNTTCDGADDPPDLHWSPGPPGTASYALQVFDPDAPNGGFTHWMLANEPANLRAPTPNTGVSGKNDFGKEGYAGPCPPHGSKHRYVVTVYAVDAIVRLEPLFSHADFLAALNGHVLATTSLSASYAR